MSGRNGMRHGHVKGGTVRAMAWQSMRILKIFSLPSLLRSMPEGTESNVRKWIRALVQAGYLREAGWNGPIGQAGSVKHWRLVQGLDDPTPPLIHKRPPTVKGDGHDSE